MGEKRGMVKPERHKDEVAVLIISFVLLSSAIWEAPDFGHMLTSAIDCMVVFFYNRICTREFLMLYVRGRAVYQFGAALIKLGLKKWKQWEFLKVSGNINFGYIGGGSNDSLDSAYPDMLFVQNAVYQKITVRFERWFDAKNANGTTAMRSAGDCYSLRTAYNI